MSGIVDLVGNSLPLIVFLLVLLLVAGGLVLFLLKRIQAEQRRQLEGWVASGLKLEMESLAERLATIEGEAQKLREVLFSHETELAGQLKTLQAASTRLQAEVEQLSKRSQSSAPRSSQPAPERTRTNAPPALRPTAKSGAATDQGQTLRQRLHQLPSASRILLETARVTATLIDQLRRAEVDTRKLDREFVSYSDLADEFRSFSRRLHSRPSMATSPGIPLAAQFERLEAKLKEVRTQHETLPFFELLDASADRPSLDESRNRLMSLLNIREVALKVGDEVQGDNVDVADISGQGERRIVRQVMARGYEHTDGRILRPPTVVIELTG